MEDQEEFSILNINDSLYKTKLSTRFLNRKNYVPADSKMIRSFIPGTVLDILVVEGQNVKMGDDLMILDAMKMQNRLKTSVDGRIKSIPVSKGDKVAKGALLIEME